LANITVLHTVDEKYNPGSNPGRTTKNKIKIKEIKLVKLKNKPYLCSVKKIIKNLENSNYDF
jgi:hypothetical protein